MDPEYSLLDINIFKAEASSKYPIFDTQCPNRLNPAYDCEPGPAVNNFYKSIWNNHIPMRNSGDALQVLNPNGELVYAFYWGTEDYPGAGSPVAVSINGLVTGHAHEFMGSEDWYNADNFATDNQCSPALPNSEENLDFINDLKSGDTDNSVAFTCLSDQPSLASEPIGTITIDITFGTPAFEIKLTAGGNSFEETSDEMGELVIDGLAAFEAWRNVISTTHFFYTAFFVSTKTLLSSCAGHNHNTKERKKEKACILLFLTHQGHSNSKIL